MSSAKLRHVSAFPDAPCDVRILMLLEDPSGERVELRLSPDETARVLDEVPVAALHEAIERRLMGKIMDAVRAEIASSVIT